MLILDEVKVAYQFMWNSQNHQLMGMAMTSQDLASLKDSYKILQDLISYAKQKHLGCKKDKANQKQKSYDYTPM